MVGPLRVDQARQRRLEVVREGKVIGRITASGPSTPVRRYHRFPITLRVTTHLPDVPPMGDARVIDGRHLVGIDYIGAGDGGRGLVSVAPLAPGRHTLRVTWPGTENATAARAFLTVTIRR